MMAFSALLSLSLFFVLVRGQQEAPPLQQQPRSFDAARGFYPDRYPAPNGNASFAYEPYGPSRTTTANPFLAPRTPLPTTSTTTTTTTATGAPSKQYPQSTTRDPFQDPNRYRAPQTHEVRDGVRYVNGRPYRLVVAFF